MTLGCGGEGMDDGSEGAWRYHKPCQLVDFNPGPYWCDFVHNWSWLWNCLNYTRFHFCWFQKWIMRSTAWLFTRFCKLCWGLWPNVHRGRQSSFVNTDRMESCALDNPPVIKWASIRFVIGVFKLKVANTKNKENAPRGFHVILHLCCFAGQHSASLFSKLCAVIHSRLIVHTWHLSAASWPLCCV